MDLKNWVSTFYFTPNKPEARNFEIGPSLKRWRFGPTRGNKGLTFPTFSLVYEKQFWLGRTEQKRVKLDENEQTVFCLRLPWQRASFFKKSAV